MPSKYDIVVVGAGIMGVASAYHLKRNNPSKRILVVERYGSPGQGNTGRSDATFRNIFSSHDNQVLSNCAIDFYIHIQEELKVDIGLQKIGCLRLQDEEQLTRSEPYLRGMKDNGVEASTYGKEDLKHLLPSLVTDFGSRNGEAGMMDLHPVEGGIFGPKCGRLDPDKLVRFYADEFVNEGGTFAFGLDAKSLSVRPAEQSGTGRAPASWQEFRVEGIAVKGAVDQVIHAETVVLAGGAWENELPEPIGMDGHVKAKKRQLFSIGAKGEKLERLFHTGGFNGLGLLPLIVLPKAGVRFEPVSEEGAFWAACEDEVNRPFINLPKHDLEEYRAKRGYFEKDIYPILKSYFPEFTDCQIRDMWAGLFAYNAFDYLPFVFRESNLIAVGGDSGSGMMKADSLGRIVDAVYREEGETQLYGEVPYHPSKLSFENRDVEREDWVV
ncbi:MAG TPA: FAD-binding oxidoreductase [Nitrososphaerales archaeon]|nr:FAD-binding oxidoreductase [Nitrososphaerales archaeon]